MLGVRLSLHKSTVNSNANSHRREHFEKDETDTEAGSLTHAEAQTALQQNCQDATLTTCTIITQGGSRVTKLYSPTMEGKRVIQTENPLLTFMLEELKRIRVLSVVKTAVWLTETLITKLAQNTAASWFEFGVLLGANKQQQRLLVVKHLDHVQNFVISFLQPGFRYGITHREMWLQDNHMPLFKSFVSYCWFNNRNP